MSDYTPLGMEKMARQASLDVALIRCPRDGVVMRIVAWRARRRDGSDETRHSTGRPPSAQEWTLTQLDVMCPACRRRGDGIPVTPRAPRAPQPA